MISNQIGVGNINLVDHDTLKRIIHDVLSDASSVKSTLGPGGKANLVHDSNNSSLYKSKDGYRIIMDMHYDDYFYDSICKLIKDASAHNNVIIGDATTSAVVILDAFYKKLETLVESHTEGFEHISLTGVTNILEALKDVLKEKLIEKGYIQFLKEYNVEDQKKIVKKVATIAANNDKAIGAYIASLFDKIIEAGEYDELFVDITPNYANDTNETSEIGFRMSHSYINRIYATEPDRITAIYNKPKYLIIEGAILDTDIEKIQPIIDYICISEGRPLVIIASDFPIKVAQWLYKLRIGGSARVFDNGDGRGPQQVILPPLQILPIQLMVTDDESHEKYVDLETALGGRAIPAISETWDSLGDGPNEWLKILGESKKITCIPFETSIVGGFGDSDAIDARIKQLQEELDHMVLISDGGASEMRKAVYKERIGLLKSNMVSIRVGGATFKERQYNCLVFEDAIYAVKSTIKNGFTLAGQVSLKHLVKHNVNEITDAVIEKLKREGRNVTFGNKRDKALKDAIAAILNVIYNTFSTAYETAIQNAIFNTEEIESIKSDMYNDELTKPLAYNLMTDSLESLSLGTQCNMVSAGNTDYETFAAVVGITNLFLNTDNLETLYIPRRATKEEEEIMKKKNNQQ